MSVSFPKMCSVLAHELRSPLSVLQGYIRLLQRQRDASHPETAMLNAMLDATGRLTGIAHQASSLGSWLAAHETPALEIVPTTAVLDEIDKRETQDGPVAVVRHEGTPVGHIHADAAALAGALVAIASSLAREAGVETVEVSQSPRDKDASTGFQLRARPSAPTQEITMTDRMFALDNGGAGLALIAASHILDAHGASLSAGDRPGSIDIRLREAGGQQ